MSAITIENIVASAQIAPNLNLKNISEAIPEAKYEDQEVPTVIIHFQIPKTVVMLRSNGELVLTGPKTIGEVDDVIRRVSVKLMVAGVKVDKNPEVCFKNIIASTELKIQPDLPTISKRLGSKNAEYDPAKFPGIKYKMDNPNAVLLLFNSGKLVCQSVDTEHVTNAIQQMTNLLTSLGVIKNI